MAERYRSPECKGKIHASCEWASCTCECHRIERKEFGKMDLGAKARWRVGTKIPLNVYEGDRPVCQCHSADDAARIVAAMNRSER